MKPSPKLLYFLPANPLIFEYILYFGILFVTSGEQDGS
jgi:hypothetical protein